MHLYFYLSMEMNLGSLFNQCLQPLPRVDIPVEAMPIGLYH